MKRNYPQTLSFCFVLIIGNAFGQIEISNETQSETKEEKEVIIEEEVADEYSTEVFFVLNRSSTNRVLEENTGIFANPLGKRADETKLKTWSFGLGFRSQLNKYLAWEGGLSYLQNGESYAFEGVDSTYNYQTTYSYVSMPLKFYYVHGDAFKIIAGGGFIPQMFFGYKQEQQWTTPLNASVENVIKEQSGYNTFVISAVLNAGVQLNLGGEWSLLVMPEYRIQLNSSYVVNDSYQHYGNALGVTFGLTLKL